MLRSVIIAVRSEYGKEEIVFDIVKKIKNKLTDKSIFLVF